MLRARNVEKNSARIWRRREKNARGGAHAANNDVAFGAVENQPGSDRVESAPDTDNAATVAERIDGLLDVGELTMAVNAVSDGHGAEVTSAGRGPMFTAVGERSGIDGRAPVNEPEPAIVMENATRRGV